MAITVLVDGADKTHIEREDDGKMSGGHNPVHTQFFERTLWPDRYMASR